jgi:hypothetical protein
VGASDEKSSGQGEGQQQQQQQPDPPQGPKPLTKWQKIGYALFGVFFAGGLVVNAIVFCEH